VPASSAHDIGDEELLVLRAPGIEENDAFFQHLIGIFNPLLAVATRIGCRHPIPLHNEVANFPGGDAARARAEVERPLPMPENDI
jgi:hypothetical protein